MRRLALGGALLLSACSGWTARYSEVKTSGHAISIENQESAAPVKTGLPLVPLSEIPREVLGQCPGFETLVRACRSGERTWWVVYKTSGGDRSVGVVRRGRHWRRQFDSPRLESHCE